MSAKLCVIVGVGPSLGLAQGRRFGREGYRIALVSRRAEALPGYVATLEAQGVPARGYAANPADGRALAAAFSQLHDDLGPADVLIYNAAIARATQPSELNVDTLMYDLAVNVAGALASAQQVIGYMRERGRGTIIFTGGGPAIDPNPQYASLSVGKAALRNLAACLDRELGVEGLHVCTVTIDGFVRTGTRFDPDRVTELYWDLHCQEPVEHRMELIYQ